MRTNTGPGESASGLSAPVRAVDRVTILVLADNYYTSLQPGGPNHQRFYLEPGRSIHAEHGESFFLETETGGRTSAALFDFGVDGGGVLNNIRLLGVDLGRVEALGLSHGHFDHFLGLAAIMEALPGRVAPGTPFYAGEEAYAQRYSRRPGQAAPTDLGRLRREDVLALGLTPVEVREPTEIMPGAYLTGSIPRVTEYEKPSSTLHIRRGETLEPDDFPGEQALFFLVRDKGLVVISGCAHAGIVNTVLRARAIAGTDRVHAVLGGFHLDGAQPALIERTVADLAAMDPDFVVPMHCTGFAATAALRQALGERFILSTAGTRYTFGD